MMEKEDDEMKEVIPATSPPPSLPSTSSGKGEGEIPDRYVEREDNGNRKMMSEVKGQTGIWRPPGYPSSNAPEEQRNGFNYKNRGKMKCSHNVSTWSYERKEKA